jgi:polysaccharide export outer membrane protein
MSGRNCGFVLRVSRGLIIRSCSRSCSILILSACVWAQAPATETPAPQIPSTTAPSSEASSTQSSSPQSSSTQSSRVLANSNVKLGVGDLIEVTVFGVPDLSAKTRISGSGDVYLPLIDYVHLADLTTDEAQELIQKRLEDGGFLRGPHVAIFVDESASQGVTMVGEVARPGTYPAIGDRRLLDMISVAGGLTDRAGRVITIERHGDSNEKVEIHLSSNLSEDTDKNVDIYPGDTIIVSRAGIIYVVGDVNHPSGFLIEDNGLSVLKALALAGGSTRTASLAKTRILRPGANGIQEIPVNLKKVLYAKAPDIPLVRGDVLFIPGSAAKAAAYRTGEAAMSLSTALAVVAVHP